MRALLLLLGTLAFGACPIAGQQGPGTDPGSAQEPATADQPPSDDPVDAVSPKGNLETSINAEESQEPPRRSLVKWNEYRGPFFTGRFGAGLLLEYAAYAQDADSKKQFKMDPDERLRDFRFILGGRLFPNIERKITWSAGIMYDGPNHQWLIRQTGVMIEVPKIWGNVFIGRSKEGFSLNKVMVGYDGWTMERSTMNDATIPILADGIKWLGYSPKHKFLWNAGYFNDIFSKDQSFSTYSSQVVARFAVLPILSDAKAEVLHVGVNFRWGRPEDNKIRFRSRPEAFPAPYFIDTSSFPSDATYMAGPEVYYHKNRWLFGSEYWWVFTDARTSGDPTFHGGDIVATYLFNDATRPYNTIGGYFKSVSPKRSVFEGGPGAWEAVLRFSYSDYDSGIIRGGRFGRITPMVNWHMSDNVRLEMAYGYGRLDRFALKGNTQFFQTRIQLQF
jgi:phosphate-selective porin OprO/OprP